MSSYNGPGDLISEMAPSEHSNNTSNGSVGSQLSVTTQHSVQEILPADSHCIVTLDRRSLEHCHVLRIEIFSEVNGFTTPVPLANPDDIQVPQLEFVLGLPQGTFNQDDPRNQMILRKDISEAYVRGDWTLVPSRQTMIQLVQWTYYDYADPTRVIYEKLSSEEPHEYHFVYLLKDLQTSSSPGLQALPEPGSPIRSHINPCYVVCAMVQKVSAQKYTASDDDLENRIQVCSGLFRMWTDPRQLVFSTPSFCLSGLSSRDSSPEVQHEKEVTKENKAVGTDTDDSCA